MLRISKLAQRDQLKTELAKVEKELQTPLTNQELNLELQRELRYPALDAKLLLQILVYYPYHQYDLNCSITSNVRQIMLDYIKTNPQVINTLAKLVGYHFITCTGYCPENEIMAFIRGQPYHQWVINEINPKQEFTLTFNTQNWYSKNNIIQYESGYSDLGWNFNTTTYEVTPCDIRDNHKYTLVKTYPMINHWVKTIYKCE